MIQFPSPSTSSIQHSPPVPQATPKPDTVSPASGTAAEPAPSSEVTKQDNNATSARAFSGFQAAEQEFPDVQTERSQPATHASAPLSETDETIGQIRSMMGFDDESQETGDSVNEGGDMSDAMKALMEQKSFGEKISDVGDQLTERQDDMAQMSPAERSETLKQATQEAGLSAEVADKASQWVSSLPEDKQAEASAYLEHLIATRGESLGEERLKGLIGKVEEMSQRDYDPRAGSSVDMAVSALHDIAAPTDIEQGDNTTTCSATTMQMALAHNNPERYLDMVDALAQNKNFEKLEPDWSFTEEGQKGDDGRIVSLDTYRSPSAKLVQNAIMEYANKSEDFTSKATFEKPAEAAEETWLADTIPAVMGDGSSYTMHHVDNGDYPESTTNKNMSAAEVMQSIREYQPSMERPLVMGYNDPEHGTGHAALVIGIDDEGVTYVDPIDGVTKKVSLEDLEKEIWSVQIPNE